ncbi:MAG: hypothetical protein EBZ69_03505 [Alphaproteobacteria bacterium]|nr:hypothetical protein [Alphaproteobacteria bacterium]NDC55867.1 hypothetical protein [Alphaproteobacteria bacterium]
MDTAITSIELTVTPIKDDASRFVVSVKDDVTPLKTTSVLDAIKRAGAKIFKGEFLGDRASLMTISSQEAHSVSVSIEVRGGMRRDAEAFRNNVLTILLEKGLTP